MSNDADIMKYLHEMERIARELSRPELDRAVDLLFARKMHDELALHGARLDAVRYCLHHPDAVLGDYRVRCECRKPKPGLLLESAASLAIGLRDSYMVGDGIVDIQAGAAAGCRTIWLGTRRCDACEAMEREGAEPDHCAPRWEKPWT